MSHVFAPFKDPKKGFALEMFFARRKNILSFAAYHCSSECLSDDWFVAACDCLFLRLRIMILYEPDNQIFREIHLLQRAPNLADGSPYNANTIGFEGQHPGAAPPFDWL